MGGAPSLILPGLWLGGQDVIEDPEFFNKRGIRFVLSLGPNTPPARINFDGRCHVNLPDVPSSDLGTHFRKIIRFLAESRHSTAGACVYVHCAAGISRSTTSVCAYLMAHLGITFEESLEFIASKRRTVCPNDGFRKQLRRFEVSQDLVDLREEVKQQAPKGYDQLRQRDLDEVRRIRPNAGVSTGAQKPDDRQRMANEARQRQNAIQAVQSAMAAQVANGGPQRHIGNGDAADGDVGLAWLVKPGPVGAAPDGGRQPVRAVPPEAARVSGAHGRRSSTPDRQFASVRGAAGGAHAAGPRVPARISSRGGDGRAHDAAHAHGHPAQPRRSSVPNRLRSDVERAQQQQHAPWPPPMRAPMGAPAAAGGVAGGHQRAAGVRSNGVR